MGKIKVYNMGELTGTWSILGLSIKGQDDRDTQTEGWIIQVIRVYALERNLAIPMGTLTGNQHILDILTEVPEGDRNLDILTEVPEGDRNLDILTVVPEGDRNLDIPREVPGADPQDRKSQHNLSILKDASMGDQRDHRYLDILTEVPERDRTFQHNLSILKDAPMEDQQDHNNLDILREVLDPPDRTRQHNRCITMDVPMEEYLDIPREKDPQDHKCQHNQNIPKEVPEGPPLEHYLDILSTGDQQDRHNLDIPKEVTEDSKYHHRRGIRDCRETDWDHIRFHRGTRDTHVLAKNHQYHKYHHRLVIREKINILGKDQQVHLNPENQVTRDIPMEKFPDIRRNL